MASGCSSGHQRHWFTKRGEPGTPTARCVRCKAPNPRLCLAEYHDCDAIPWVESAVEQCRAAGVPIFVKQDSGPRPGQQGRIPDRLWLKEFPA